MHTRVRHIFNHNKQIGLKVSNLHVTDRDNIILGRALGTTLHFFRRKAPRLISARAGSILGAYADRYTVRYRLPAHAGHLPSIHDHANGGVSIYFMYLL